MFLSLCEISIAIILLTLLVTQIIVPAFKGTQLFPYLRKEGGLVEKLTEIKQKASENGLEKQIEQIKKTIK